jgi:hypothetical protein
MVKARLGVSAVPAKPRTPVRFRSAPLGFSRTGSFEAGRDPRPPRVTTPLRAAKAGTVPVAETASDIITIAGEQSYETQIGGETYVPKLRARYIVE